MMDIRWLLGTAALLANTVGAHVNASGGLSPVNWPQAERQRVERLESMTVWPIDARTLATERGIVSATVSPIAAYTGVRALESGGDAADAAAAVALTQVATQLGSVVSYAGIMSLLYYDAKTHQVYSLDAGYNSYLHETEPQGIPVSDLGPLNAGRQPTIGGAKGRETLVPGFMAGIDALHGRFGRLPYRELFAPAIWYATQGVVVSPVLAQYFRMRQSFLARTPEGRQFLGQSGHELPKEGDVFKQPMLADTLRAVARHGARQLYTGPWGQEFVRIVQREGGRVTAEDLARYRPIWSEPYRKEAFGNTVYVNGPPHLGSYGLFAALEVAQTEAFEHARPYWTDPASLLTLARITERAAAASANASPESHEAGGAVSTQRPGHSNAIVVVDAEGNIAAVTHTINSVIWGDTGIVVGGIPIPDSAGFQQLRLAALKPGDRVPHEIIDTITLNKGLPVLATAGIGVALLPESLRIVLAVLAQHEELGGVLAAPPLLFSFGTQQVSTDPARTLVRVPQNGYSSEFLAQVRASGATVDEVPSMQVLGLRGTVAAVQIDPQSNRRTAVDVPGVMVFNAAQ
jgi:gamma-glutamyltranspeptidase/glutathione hydrolase